ncbi:MAG: FliM/FliN family flagellar motor switch protein [Candidatus Acidiferrales bacterium]
MAETLLAPAVDSAATPAPALDVWAEMLSVSATVSVEVAIVGLTVRELFRLEKGSIVASSQLSTANVPVVVGGKLMAYGEFQVVGENLALRVAELA